MNITNLFSSSVGKKFVMAVTGLMLLGFVVGHMLGNLQFFLGHEAINRYGNFLQTTVEILWPARIGLLVVVGLHIWSAVKLSLENKAARPVAYANQKLVSASYASRTMIYSGFIILAFIIYHLLHFTAMVQSVNLIGKDFSKLVDDENHHDIYAMIILGFKNPAVAVFYIFAQFLLFQHLGHGIAALCQSLGLKTPGYKKGIDMAAKVVSWGLFVGYCSVPLAVLVFGYGTEYVNHLKEVVVK